MIWREFKRTMDLTLRAIVSAAILAAASLSNAGAQSPQQQANMMRITLSVEGQVLSATLEDTATSRDFVSLLPLTITLKDYASTEKISDLPKRLSTAGAPEGTDPSIGDIAYYAPWGNLAIFYRDWGYGRGLIKLGRLDSGIEMLQRPGPLQATIALSAK
jgi:hypothetical protein